MKQLKFFVLAGLAAVLVTGCGSVQLIDEVSGMKPKGNAFTQAAYTEYLMLAKAEQDESDIDDAVFFANKAKAAAMGEGIAPQAMAERTIPKFAKKTMVKERAALVSNLWNGGEELSPKAAAKAVAMFDCWMQEQEENNQPPDIAACRKAFNIAKLDIKTRPKAKMAKPMMKKAAPRAPMPAPYVVYFGFDSAEVSGSEMVKIKQAYADYRLRNPGKILVAGHTDTSGNKEYNQGLSRYRAAEVSNRLMELGVPRKMVQRSRHGEVAPVVETGDNAREGKNRRVTITFIR
ncbi:MAG: OmpA family protein [Rhodospirillaceae bacterium]|jgi:OmpA-OmpF porin, OOP family|nr:OmpA family protein [Rhodospirillaceae bacterium]